MAPFRGLPHTTSITGGANWRVQIMHTRKTSKTERTFIESSIELISVKGIKGTSIRDIANATGMSISNIYHYFGKTLLLSWRVFQL